MRLTAGARLGPYEIHAPLGAGGMGEVYRARDTNLARDVAVKVLPEAVAHDAERLARFEREARTLAALDHPNIAIVHGLENVPATGGGQLRALVMELVDGPTLAELIGGLAVPDALRIARQIADGLEAAHEQAIVHRDLKPANVKVRSDGTVKVLDFGLAKASEPVNAISPLQSISPTITSPAMTAAGLILGTAAYMSPEQAKGREADKRSDVFSFGAVLYEMLTGRRAFAGDDVSDTLASVLRSEPDWSIVPADVPPAVVSLMKGCLAKDRRERVSDMSAVKFVLKDLSTIGAAPSVPSRPSASTWRARVLPVAITAAITAAIVGTAAWMMRPRARPADVARFSLIAEGPFTSVVHQMIALSRDGTRIAYSAGGHIRVRSLSEQESRPITDLDYVPLSPAFAPEGDAIAFIAVSEGGPAVRRISVGGGTAATLATLEGITNFSGMSWNADGILVGTTAGGGILRVPSEGGKPERVVSVAPDETAHGPQLLPDGRTILFTLAKDTADDRWDKATIVAQSLADNSRRVLIEGGADARYLESGHLLYAVSGTAYAVPFDLKTLAVRGTAVPVVVGVRRAASGTNGGAQLAVSSTGTMAYVPGPAASSSARGLVLGDGRSDPAPLNLPPGFYAHPRVSPDGRVLAVSRGEGGATDIWTYELSGKTVIQRLTFGGQSRFPVWSADSRRVTYQSARDRAVWWQGIDGGAAERLTSPLEGEEHIPESWSPDGTRLLFAIRKASRYTLWLLTLKGLKAEPFGDVYSMDPLGSSFSPDGRWVVYASSPSAAGGALSPNRGVFVEPFPPTGMKRQAPKRLLDFHPRWSHDGNSVIYVPGTGRSLVSVPVNPGPPFVFGTSVDLTRAPVPGILSVEFRGYDVLPDGRIVSVSSSLGQAASGASASEIRIVLNWFEELKRLASVK